MSTVNEKHPWVAPAILAAAGLAVALLVWRSYRNDAPRIENYTAPPSRPAPPVSVPPRIETVETLNVLAEGHLAARRFGPAVQAYRRMLELEPGSASIYNELGLALHYDGKSEAALEALKKATELDPKLQRAWLSRGFVLKSLGRDAQAREALKKTIALDPATAQGREALGMLNR